MWRLGALGAVGLWGRRGHRCARDGPCKVKRIACGHARNVARRRSFRSVLMCGFLFVAGVLWTTPASAQEVATSFDDLSRSRALRTGDSVSVENIDGEWLRGEIVELSLGGLELKNSDESWVMEATDVVEIRRRDGLSEGVWLGAGAGYAATLLYTRMATDGEQRTYTALAMIGPAIAVGIVVGVIMDARRQATVYRRSDAARVHVVPMVTSDTVGGGLSLTW